MMRSFLNKALNTLTAVVLSTSFLQADDSDDSCYLPKIEPCYGYAYNPGAFIADSCGWYANVAYLYWKPYQEGISAGTINALNENSVGFTYTADGELDFLGTAVAKQVYPKFDWDSGFRLGLGYHFPCDSWNVGLEYTRYCTNTHKSIASTFTYEIDPDVVSLSTPIQGTLFSPAYTGFFDSNNIFSASQSNEAINWKIQFNQLDLDFSREYYVARTTTVRPHAGLRALFITQHYDLYRATSGINFPIRTGDTNVTSESIEMKNNFKGVGLQGGLDLSFDLGWNLAFYGELGAGATWGNACTLQHDVATSVLTSIDDPTTSTTLPIDYTLKDYHDILLVNADFAFGFQWRERINNDESLLTVKLGYEEHIFFGYNRFRSLSGPSLQGVIQNSPTGNLSLYGIVCSAAIDF